MSMITEVALVSRAKTDEFRGGYGGGAGRVASFLGGFRNSHG